MRKILIFIWEVTKMVVISLAIIIPVRYFLIQPFYVKGASMEPNFHDREYLIIDEISYRFNEPERGDIVVFRYPYNTEEFFIKRVIGLPGESVRVSGGDIHIFNDRHPDGYILEEDYLPENLRTHSFNTAMVELSSEQFYVLGDNRQASKDSRSFGPVGRDLVIGKVFFRGWPFDKISVFDSIEYSIE